jgi:uncharacterized Zn finger protein
VSPPRGHRRDRDSRDRGEDLKVLRARLTEAERKSAVAKKQKQEPAKKQGNQQGKQQGKQRTPKTRTVAEPADELVDDEHDNGDGYEPGYEADGPQGRWWEHEDAGRPRPVAGGVSARTKKGPIGATWWSRRFLGSLESVMVGGRMERGRSYARKGQVVRLQIDAGVVSATVQGSREDPYVVHVRMPVVHEEDWDRILRALAASAGYAARMLAGDLPHEVEGVFESEGASLLPAPHARLVTECTCPDWENPCKHIAAVCYLLAEAFDRDPFSLLAWRGRGREEVLGGLRALRGEAAGGEDGAGEEAGGEAAGAEAAAREAAGAEDGSGHAADPRDLLERFWSAGPGLAHVHIRPEEAAQPAAALRLAPRGVLFVRGGDVVDVLAPSYRVIAAAAAARAVR